MIIFFSYFVFVYITNISLGDLVEQYGDEVFDSFDGAINNRNLGNSSWRCYFGCLSSI